MSIGIGMETTISGILSQFVGAEIMVMSKLSSSRPNVPGEVVDILKGIDHVEDSFGVIQDYLEIEGEMVLVISSEPEEIEFLMSISLEYGMTLQEAEQLEIPRPAYIDTTLKNALGLDVGDNLLATSQISGTFLELTIVGVVSSFDIGMGFGGFGGMVYTTLGTMQEILSTDAVQVVMLTLDDSSYSSNVADSIREAYPDAQVITQEEILAMTDEILNIIFAVLLGMAAISLLVGAIGIMNTTMTSVLERTREIGILKAIGAKRINILQVFLTEAFIISLLGGIIGCIGSVVLVLALTQVVESFLGFMMPYSFEPMIFVGGMLLSVVIGLVSAAYPAWRASSIKPVEALRYE
jgi:putative ABC transport system permease protein